MKTNLETLTNAELANVEGGRFGKHPMTHGGWCGTSPGPINPWVETVGPRP